MLSRPLRPRGAVDQPQDLLPILDRPGCLAVGPHPLLRLAAQLHDMDLVAQGFDHSFVERPLVAGDGGLDGDQVTISRGI